MKKIIVFSFLVAVFVLLIYNCNTDYKNSGFIPDSKLNNVHGAIINDKGLVIQPAEDYIITAQKYYITELKKSLNIKDEREVRKVERVIYKLIKDKIIANAFFLDWLTEHGNHVDIEYIGMINNSLRWHYISNIQKNPVLPTKDRVWTKGIEKDIFDKSEFKELNLVSPDSPFFEEPRYTQRCLDAGVPVPENFNDEGFIGLGLFEPHHSNADEKPELKIYRSEDPPGFCLSVTRPNGNDYFYNVICFGTQSNNACFFERQTMETKEEVFPKNDLSNLGERHSEISMTCTKCHIGENPFIIHPGAPAFIAAKDSMNGSLMGTDWYQPLGDSINSDYQKPVNQQPNNLMKLIPSVKKCTNCHNKTYGGRLPDNLTDYICPIFDDISSDVFTNTSSFSPTMPFGDLGSRGDYIHDINWFLRNCIIERDEGKITKVDTPDDPDFIGSPVVDNRLYQCATEMVVRSVLKKADVTLYINNVQVSKQFNVKPINGEIKFDDLNPLIKGDKISANQELDGTLSNFSPIITVRDHREDYPNGIPTPTIDPSTIYECASAISIRYDFTGAELTLFTNDASPVTVRSFDGHTPVIPGKSPIEIGDVFTVQAKMCDELSSLSEEVFAVEAPDVLPPVTISDVQENQQILKIGNLTYGSESSIVKTGIGIVGEFSSPLSWYNLYLNDPINEGDEYTGLQTLCDISTEIRMSFKIKPCSDLKAPLVKQPLIGEDFVVVLQSIGEARIHVFDQSGNEIGDGVGPIVMLNRKLESGNTIYVVQALGDCRSASGHSFTF